MAFTNMASTPRFFSPGFRLGSAETINESHPTTITISPYGRPPRCHCRMMEAMIYRVRIGCRWRDLPEIFGNWKSVYTRWRQWNQNGLWEAVLSWLEPSAEGQLRHLDATYIKVHQDASNPAGGQCLQAIGTPKAGSIPSSPHSWMAVAEPCS